MVGIINFNRGNVLEINDLRGGVKRQSNLELLRIVAMLLVLLIHYTATIDVTHETLLSAPIRSIAVTTLHSLSVVCVNCFILISGYFGIRWKMKSITSLLYQILFWLLIGMMVASVCKFDTSISWLKCITSFFSGRWFVPAYLMLYITAPLINSFIEKNSPRQIGLYIIIFYTYSTVVGYLLKSTEFNEGMSAISLIGLYLIGAYIRKSDLRCFSFPAKVNLLIYFSFALILAMLTCTLLYFGIEKSPIGYLNPIVIVMSVYLFLFFQKLNVGEIRVINFIAASAFAVYLLHMHPAIYGEYQHICQLLTENGIVCIVYIPLFFISIFSVCVVLDRMRIWSFNLIYPIFSKK